MYPAYYAVCEISDSIHPATLCHMRSTKLQLSSHRHHTEEWVHSPRHTLYLNDELIIERPGNAIAVVTHHPLHIRWTSMTVAASLCGGSRLPLISFYGKFQTAVLLLVDLLNLAFQYSTWLYEVSVKGIKDEVEYPAGLKLGVAFS
jgi:hypothetical protein